MRRFLLFYLILLLILFQLNYLYFPSNQDQGNVAGLSSQLTRSLTISALVGKYHFTLFGYSSPQALVIFDGQGIFDQTIADSQGYFIFKDSFSPLSSTEACLSAKDQFGRVSSPVCLPSFPINSDVTIGPVLLAPTVSLNKDIYYVDDGIVLSGQTIPNSQIDLSVFTQTSSQSQSSNFLTRLYAYLLSSNFHLIVPVEAISFPGLNTKSDSKGNFSFSLPSNHTDKIRLFTQVAFDQGISPESVKLNFQIYPWWMVIIQFFLFIFNIVKSRWLELTIIAEILYLVLILVKEHNRAIILRKGFAITRKKKLS